MTGSEILQKFNLQIDDSSELSDSEALDLANDVYQEIQDDRPWEWLNKTFDGSTSESVPYVALPSDFKQLRPNYNGLQSGSFTNLGVPQGYRAPAYTNTTNITVVFVGTTLTPYQVIPQSQYRNYVNTDGYCYIDVPNTRLVFTKQPTSVQAVSYDYVSIAPALLTSTSPLFRSGFHKIIAFGMAVKFSTLEQSMDKGSSWQRENQIAYSQILDDLRVEDSELKLAYV